MNSCHMETSQKSKNNNNSLHRRDIYSLPDKISYVTDVCMKQNFQTTWF